MGLFNIFRNQLAEVIQWKNKSPDLLWIKYISTLNEIKNASKIIVAPGQGCVLVYEGKIIDIIEQEGIYNLKTDNHPFITTLQNLWQNFESEHKLFIYFYRKTEILNQSWGSVSPIKYVDSVYNIPVKMGVNGTFSYFIADINYLFTTIIGNKDTFTTEDIKSIIFGRIPQLISETLAENKFSYQEIDAKLPQIANQTKEKLHFDYEKIGLKLSDFRINGTQFDKETQERIAKVADISADVIAAEKAGLDYVALEKLRALRDAARNEGGLAGAGLQLGVGMELGKAFNINKDEFLSKTDDDIKKLKKLKLLLDEKIISNEEFELKKNEIISKL
ncbi:MAG: SPFH domain-containing protein [Flavobacterium sp.]